MPNVLQANRLKAKTIGTPMSNDPKAPKNLAIVPLKSAPMEIKGSEVESRPKNLRANLLPTDGYGLEVDGRVKAQYETAEVATKAGLELKLKYPQIQVKIFDAKERTRIAVELPA